MQLLQNDCFLFVLNYFRCSLTTVHYFAGCSYITFKYRSHSSTDGAPAQNTIVMQNNRPVGFPPVSNGLLGHQAEYITPTSSDSLQFIVGREDCPTGLRKLVVSRPHVVALSPRFGEVIKQKSKNTKQVLLPEDDADIIRLIMLVGHLQSTKIPPKLDLNELIRLAQVVERYEVGHILLPYLDAWLAPHREKMFDAGYEEWLFISYHFGLEEDYLLLANHLVLNCRTDNQCELLQPATGSRTLHTTELTV